MTEGSWTASEAAAYEQGYEAGKVVGASQARAATPVPDEAALVKRLARAEAAITRVLAVCDTTADTVERGAILAALFVDDRPMTEDDIQRGQQIERWIAAGRPSGGPDGH